MIGKMKNTITILSNGTERRIPIDSVSEIIITPERKSTRYAWYPAQGKTCELFGLVLWDTFLPEGVYDMRYRDLSFDLAIDSLIEGGEMKKRNLYFTDNKEVWVGSCIEIITHSSEGGINMWFSPTEFEMRDEIIKELKDVFQSKVILDFDSDSVDVL